MDWQFNQIQQTPDGLMESTGSDPYIVFPLFEDTRYDASGVQFEIFFNPIPIKPVMMELFWRPELEGFSEFRKVFFVLLPPKTGHTIKFIVPLRNRTGYKGFRLDFPRDLATPFLVKDFTIISGHHQPDNVEIIEPYQHLTVAEAKIPEVMIPYLWQTFRHGMSRLSKDPVFLIFWLFLMGIILISTRIVGKSIRKDDK